MHKFLVRAASGIIYAAVIVIAIAYGGWAMWLLAAAFAVIGIIELDRMQIGISDKTLPILLLDIFGVLSLVSIAVNPIYGVLVWFCLQVVRFVISRRIVRNSDTEIRIPVDGQVYLGIPFAFMIYNSYGIDMPRMLPLLIFALLWLNDSGAYIVGSLMGRHKMSPKISPKKTWEGFAGGVVITVAGASLLYAFCDVWFGMQLSLIHI